MAANVALQRLQGEITNLRHIVQDELTPSQKIDFELAVNGVARAIIEVPLQKKDADELFDQLLGIRALTIHHVPATVFTGNGLFINMIQHIPPSPICPANNKFTFPTISTNRTRGNNFVCIRLDHTKALDHVPETVKSACPLEGKDVEVLYTVIRGDFYGNQQFPLNNSVNSWALNHALPGETVSTVVNMGIFPEIGMQESDLPGTIAFNRLSRSSAGFNVPSDTAFFYEVPGSPFSVDWSVMQSENRVAITKRIVLFNENHPICHAIINSIYGCRGLSDHLSRLPRISAEIDNILGPVIAAFETDNEAIAMRLFHQLPLAFQHGAYTEAWVAFGSPPHIPQIFGRASFEKEKSLDAQYHCNQEQCSAAVQRFSVRLKHLLVDSQNDLLLRSQSLVKGDNVLTMMKCAKLFYEKPYTKALEAFDQLPEPDKEAVRYAFWELNDCQLIKNFGTEKFPLNLNSNPNRELKIQSVLLAASRQPHRFVQPPIEKNGADGNKFSLLNLDLAALQQYLELADSDGNFEDEEIPASSVFSTSSTSSTTTTTTTTPSSSSTSSRSSTMLGDILKLRALPSNNISSKPSTTTTTTTSSSSSTSSKSSTITTPPAVSAYYSTSSTSSTSSTTTKTPTITTIPQVNIREVVNDQIINLVTSQEFRTRLTNVEKASIVNQILSRLSENDRNDIHGSVWHNSRDSNKKDGNPNWGRDHVADDLEVLAEAVQQVFGIY